MYSHIYIYLHLHIYIHECIYKCMHIHILGPYAHLKDWSKRPEINCIGVI
jgi:hypothetical protein